MLTLYLNATSPYARLVRICALEKQILLNLAMVDPWGSPDTLLQVNPAAKVPVLITDAGVALSETLLILQYLDIHSPCAPRMDDNEQVMQWLGLGQALMDSAFQTVIANKYNELNGGKLAQRRHRAIERILTQLESEYLLLIRGTLTVAHYSIAVGLAYLDFRLSELNWQTAYPQLASWYADIVQRPSFQQTQFS
ncbi:glutathione S-transferase family protein [Vibrio metschnikovii]|uniref:glutathione S-transferase family protein n=1 Tax=Vibrio metschnikovii TaxID=28172 RepID=UPI001C2F5AC9|nr:glutathione S-transferase family protein [Vibrio metschnikovii]